METKAKIFVKSYNYRQNRRYMAKISRCLQCLPLSHALGAAKKGLAWLEIPISYELLCSTFNESLWTSSYFVVLLWAVILCILLNSNPVTSKSIATGKLSQKYLLKFTLLVRTWSWGRLGAFFSPRWIQNLNSTGKKTAPRCPQLQVLTSSVH